MERSANFAQGRRAEWCEPGWPGFARMDDMDKMDENCGCLGPWRSQPLFVLTVHLVYYRPCSSSAVPLSPHMRRSPPAWYDVPKTV